MRSCSIFLLLASAEFLPTADLIQKKEYVIFGLIVKYYYFLNEFNLCVEKQMRERNQNRSSTERCMTSFHFSINFYRNKLFQQYFQVEREIREAGILPRIDQAAGRQSVDEGRR